VLCRISVTFTVTQMTLLKCTSLKLKLTTQIKVLISTIFCKNISVYLVIFQCWSLPIHSRNILQREWCEKNFLRFNGLLSAKNIRDQLLSEVAKVRDSSRRGGREDREGEGEARDRVSEKGRDSDRDRDKDRDRDRNTNRRDGDRDKDRDGRDRGGDRDRDRDRGDGYQGRTSDGSSRWSGVRNEKNILGKRGSDSTDYYDRGAEEGREKTVKRGVEIDRRVCMAIAAGFFSNVARKSANSDSMFYPLPLPLTLPLALPFSDGSDDPKGNNYSYDNNEKLILHVHPSSVLTHCSSSAAVAAGCWPRQPEYVIYQEINYFYLSVIFCRKHRFILFLSTFSFTFHT
jgi:hypothetical protein